MQDLTQAPLHSTSTAVPATFANVPARCDLNTWCARGAGHYSSCESTHLGLPFASWPQAKILKANLWLDDETGETVVQFAADGSEWIEYQTGDELREYTAKVRAHLLRLDLLADQHDAIREGNAEDMPAGAAPAAVTVEQPRGAAWGRRIKGGGYIQERCPSWCDALHDVDQTQSRVFDSLTHSRAIGHGFDIGGDQVTEVLSATIQQDPYSEDEHRRIPNVQFYLAADEVRDGVGPDEFEKMIRSVEAHVACLWGMHARLVAARAEYEQGQQS